MLVIFIENVKCFCKKFEFGARNGSTNGAVEDPYTLLCSLSVFCKFLSPQYV